MASRLRFLFIIGFLFLCPVVFAVNVPTACPDGSMPLIPPFAEPAPFCPIGSGLASEFVLPTTCTEKTEADACMVNSFAFPKNAQDYAGTNKMYGLTGSDGQRYVIQVSNDKSLDYQLRGDGVYFLQDTTFTGNPKTDCTNGYAAFQRIYSSSGSPGALMLPPSISCGNTYDESGINRAFEYLPAGDARGDTGDAGLIAQKETELRPFPQDSTQKECVDKNPMGAYSSSHQIIYIGPAKCGNFSGDIMVSYNKGAGAGETSMYCKGFGLCGWYEEIDWNNPKAQPATWNANTDLCAGFPSAEPYCEVTCDGPGRNNNPPQAVRATQQFAASIIAALSAGSKKSVDILAEIKPTEDKHKLGDNRKHDSVVAGALGKLTPGEIGLDLNSTNKTQAIARYSMTANQRHTSETSRFGVSNKDVAPDSTATEGTSTNYLPNAPKAPDWSNLTDDHLALAPFILSDLIPDDRNPTLTLNDGNNYSFSRWDWKIKEKYMPPTEPVDGRQGPAQDTNPDGVNEFKEGTSDTPLPSLVTTVTQSILDTILSLTGFITLEGTAQLNSCSVVASQDLLHTKLVTNHQGGFLPAKINAQDNLEVRDNRVTNKYEVFGEYTLDQPHNEYGQNKNNLISCHGYKSTQPRQAQETALRGKIPGCTDTDYPTPLTDPGGDTPDPGEIPDQGFDPSASLCTGLSKEAIGDIAKEYARGIRYPPEPDLAKQNFLDYSPVIDQALASAGIPINPSAFYAFWIEETMASAVYSSSATPSRTFGLGCRGDYIPGNPYGDAIGLDPGIYQTGSAEQIDATVRAHVLAQTQCMINTMKSAIGEVGTEPKALYTRYVIERWAADGTLVNALQRLMRLYNQISPACGQIDL